MATTEVYKIRERVMDAWYGPRAALLRGTIDSGDTDTVVDAALALPGATADRYDYGYIKIRSDTAGAAPQGEVRAIDEGGFTPGTGSFETAAFTAAVAAGDTMEVHPEWHPDTLDTIRNKLLRELHMPSFFPLSMDLVASDNNDFEQAVSDPTVTGWTENGGAAVASAHETTRIHNGVRSLKLTHATAATGYYSRQFSVTAARTYYSAVAASCDTGGTAIFRLFDATNSATIDDGRTTQTNMQDIVFQWSPPSGCRTAEVRLLGGADTDVTYWDDYQAWYSGQGVYPLPSWITRKEQIIDIVGYPPGQGGPSSDYDYVTNEHQSHSLPWRWERADTRATNELHVWVQTYSNWRPYIIAYRPLDEVTADYVTTTANTIPLSSTEADALVLGILAEMHEQKSVSTVGAEQAKHVRLAKDYKKQWISGTNHLRPPEASKVHHNRVWGSVA